MVTAVAQCYCLDRSLVANDRTYLHRIQEVFFIRLPPKHQRLSLGFIRSCCPPPPRLTGIFLLTCLTGQPSRPPQLVPHTRINAQEAYEKLIWLMNNLGVEQFMGSQESGYISLEFGVMKPDPHNASLGDSTTESRISIGEFIEKNDKLLAVLGVFLGAATITNNAQIKIIGQIVTFLFIGSALLIWSELFFRLKGDRHPDKRLVLFAVLFIAGFIATILYWMVEFNEIMRLGLAAILLQVLYAHSGRLQRSRSKLSAFVIWLVLLAATAFLAQPINNWLDRFRTYLLSQQTPQQTHATHPDPIPTPAVTPTVQLTVTPSPAATPSPPVGEQPSKESKQRLEQK